MYLTRNQANRKVPRVRIPPSPPDSWHSRAFAARFCFQPINQSIIRRETGRRSVRQLSVSPSFHHTALRLTGAPTLFPRRAVTAMTAMTPVPASNSCGAVFCTSRPS
jgi:hypothetical protein